MKSGKSSGVIETLAKKDWDYLIILDACRYDYFKNQHNNFLKGGELKKEISPALHTMEWLNKVFPDYYEDIVYISSNPWVNSKMEVSDTYGYKYDGKKHFHKIIDVWDDKWDNKLATVHPKSINIAFLNYYNNYKNKRFILHYMQPHRPFISDRYACDKRGTKPDEMPGDFDKLRGKDCDSNRNNVASKFKRLASKAVSKTLGVGVNWRISNVLYGGLLEKIQSPSIYFEEGWPGIKKAYRENLEIVLESVGELVQNIKGKYIITADHGEFLGEYRRYGHPDDFRRPENTEVPWLEISNGQREAAIDHTSESESETAESKLIDKDEEKIKEKLRSLGYF